MPTSERGGRDWDGRATSSLAADAASSTSERVERTESGGGKKSKMQQKYLNATSDDLWCIRDKLAGKKSSLGKTYKTNTEANEKVDELNQQASKYVETLALLYANFERICAETKEAEEQFDLRQLKSLYPGCGNSCTNRRGPGWGFESYPQEFPGNGLSNLGLDLWQK